MSGLGDPDRGQAEAEISPLAGLGKPQKLPRSRETPGRRSGLEARKAENMAQRPHWDRAVMGHSTGAGSQGLTETAGDQRAKVEEQRDQRGVSTHPVAFHAYVTFEPRKAILTLRETDVRAQPDGGVKVGVFREHR